MTEPKQHILVAGPYTGEFGWECFSWQPMVRGTFLKNRFDRCLAFTGPGRAWMYRFAETRTLPGMPKHEAECHGWVNMSAHRAEIEAAIRSAVEVAKLEQGAHQVEVGTLNVGNLPNLADTMYGAGQPDLLYPDPSPRPSRFWRGGDRPRIVLCVRDRQLADHRNWPYDHWRRLCEMLQDECDVVVVGHVTRPKEWVLPALVTDATNATTVDDLIELFSQAALAAGGSTGTLHLASRCGCDHVAWGPENPTAFPLPTRYAETNWFGARCEVLTSCAWRPEPEQAAEAIRERLSSWRRERKPRVAVTFDDFPVEHVAAAEALSRLGIRGTFAAVTGLVGTPGYPTWERARAVARAGHCVCSHGHAHARLAPDSGRAHLRPVGPRGVTADAVRAREELLARGLDGRIYVAPFGTENVGGGDHLERLLEAVDFVRLTVGAPLDGGWVASGMHRHLPSGFRGRICGITCAADTRWPGRVRERIDECARAGTTCVLLYHGVTHCVGSEMDMTWREFVADMEHLKKSGVETVTLKELVG